MRRPRENFYQPPLAPELPPGDSVHVLCKYFVERPAERSLTGQRGENLKVAPPLLGNIKLNASITLVGHGISTRRLVNFMY